MWVRYTVTIQGPVKLHEVVVNATSPDHAATAAMKKIRRKLKQRNWGPASGPWTVLGYRLGLDRCLVCGTICNAPGERSLCEHVQWFGHTGWIYKKPAKGDHPQEQKYSVNWRWRGNRLRPGQYR